MRVLKIFPMAEGKESLPVLKPNVQNVMCLATNKKVQLVGNVAVCIHQVLFPERTGIAAQCDHPINKGNPCVLT